MSNVKILCDLDINRTGTTYSVAYSNSTARTVKTGTAAETVYTAAAGSASAEIASLPFRCCRGKCRY